MPDRVRHICHLERNMIPVPDMFPASIYVIIASAPAFCNGLQSMGDTRIRTMA
jgi:hypothetical protein